MNRLERLNEAVADMKDKLKQGELSKKDFDKSIQKTNREVAEIASWSPDSAAVLTSAARVLTQTGDSKTALSYADKAVKISPEDPFPLVTRGILRYQKRDFDGAAGDAVGALKSDPANKAAYALYKLATGPHPESGGAAHTASAAAPQTISQLLAWSSPLNHPELLSWGRRAKDRVRALSLLKRSMNEFKLNNPKAVLETAAQAQELDPSIPDIYMQKALAYTTMAKYPAPAAEQASPESLTDKALDELHKAAVLWETGNKKDSLAVAYEMKSMLEADKKDFAGALEAAEEAVRLRPASAGGYFYRARAQEGLNKNVEAILADYKKASELDPTGYGDLYQEALKRYAGVGQGKAGTAASATVLGAAARDKSGRGGWLYDLGRLATENTRRLALAAVAALGIFLAFAGWRRFKS